MAEGESLDLKQFGATFRGFMEQVAAQAPLEEPVFARRIREHFGAAAADLPILAEKFPQADRPNLQRAFDAFLARGERQGELLGVSAGPNAFMSVTLADLVSGGGQLGVAPALGPVQYANLPIGRGEVLACLQSGLHLVRDGESRLAILVSGGSGRYGDSDVKIEVMAASQEEGARCLAELRTLSRQKNVYRGQIVSLDLGSERAIKVSFHHLPEIRRDAIILPPGILERIERHTVHFARHREKLLAAGRHLKRGILLHGPPGTGKTLTAMYLAAQMKERTVLLLTGRGQGLLEESCAMARLLQPSTIILEDADLIATDRAQQTSACNALLFELLNEMDGLADDADVLFLLTTNRPEALEPALASRPGRIDMAIEVPLPDAASRRRLIELYGAGLSLHLERWDALVARTEGASGAFIRELLRRAALFAADDDGALAVVDRHVEEALHDLVVDGGPLTAALLGARRAAAPTP